MATATQRADLRADFGLADDETVFTNAEVDRLFVRAAVSYSTDGEIEAYARVLGCNQLRAKAVNMTDYTANDSSEKLSQVFTHLDALKSGFEKDLAASVKANSASVRIGKPKYKPTRLKDYPDA